ncbi:MFS general substrate transporter [Apiospora aurea]|uniref:MFS general substrate transporter n=1 Tax=Apiospora aurea TaxID=335848 RepID=A0ABR1QXM7_9PEZI
MPHPTSESVNPILDPTDTQNIRAMRSPVHRETLTAEKGGWRWTFWLLTILSGSLLLCIILFFPETCQRIVGNGSVPATGYNRTVVSFLRPRPAKEESQDAERQTLSTAKEASRVQGGKSRRCHVPNPLSILKILLDKGSFSTMFAGSMAYTIFGCLGASLSAHCIQIYRLNYLQAGLIYLPAGMGGILAAYTIAGVLLLTGLEGRLLDRDYKLTARKHGVDADRGKEDNLDEFPIEEARLRSVWYLMVPSILATIGYGWSLDQKSHLAVPLLMQLITGSTMVGMFTIFSTLLSDLNPGYTSTSQAAYNLVRCLLGAAGIAALEAMVDGARLGWCFTIMGLILACTVPLLVLLQARGHQWRRCKANVRSEGGA